MWRQIIEPGTLFLMLGIYAIEDLKKRSITSWYLIPFGLLGIGFRILWKDIAVPELMGGILLGIFLLILSYLTRESIGMGDALVFLVTGVYLGGITNLELLFISLLYAALFSLGIIIVRKQNQRKREIPFIPFVFLGYGTMLLGAIT